MLRSTDIFSRQQLVALGLHHEKFQPVPEGEFKLRRIPRLADVFVNRAAVDGGNRGVEVRVGRDEDAQDARAQLPGAFEQPDAFFAGHPLVGQQQADFVGVLFEQLEAVLRVRGGEHAEIVAEGALEILQRFFLVIHVEDGEFFVVVEIFHVRLSIHSLIGFDREIPA